MPWALRPCLASVAASALMVTAVPAQNLTDRPTPLSMLRPLSRLDLNHREALTLFTLGLVQERQNRLLEAVRSFEEAARLEPDAAPVHKTLIPLYFALDRKDQALV